MSEKTDVWQGTLTRMVLKTRAGHKRLAKETQKWETTTAILTRFFAPPQES
jgi:hypothetical protein